MPPSSPEPSDDHVPLFGSWRSIYAWIVALALLVMLLLRLFSRWPF